MDKIIVFFDIDGTLYRFDTGTPKDTLEALDLLKKNGHIPVICTGRTRCMIYKEHLEPGFDYIVAGGGTYIEVENEQKFLSELDNTDAYEIIDAFLENNFVPVAEGRDNIYLGRDQSDLTPRTQEVINVYYENMSHCIKYIDDKDLRVSKVSALFTNKSNPQAMIDKFSDRYNIINHNNNLLELLPKSYNKAKGIELMIKELDIPWENTYAFGDSFNDLDMLQYVKYGCAMGNSDKEIIEKTKYVTDDFDKGGIYNGLKMFGLI